MQRFAELLCCTLEMSVTLCINYNSIKKVFPLKERHVKLKKKKVVRNLYRTIYSKSTSEVPTIMGLSSVPHERGHDISYMARMLMVQQTMSLPTTKLMHTEKALLGSLSTGIKDIKDLYKVRRKTVNCPETPTNKKRA